MALQRVVSVFFGHIDPKPSPQLSPPSCFLVIITFYYSLLFFHAGLLLGNNHPRGWIWVARAVKQSEISFDRYVVSMIMTCLHQQIKSVLLIITCDPAGITNGVDTNEWNPSIDPHLPSFYSIDDLSGKVMMLPKLLILFRHQCMPMTASLTICCCSFQVECKAALQAELGLPIRPDVPLVRI